MVQCNYCTDDVSMPYKCSLCAKRHCSKHRLPESHQCANLGVYNTDTYRKQKLEKARLPRNAIVSSSISTGSMEGGARGTFWSSGDETQNVVYSGLLVGLIALMPAIVSSFSNITYAIGTSISGVMGMFVIYIMRRRTAQNHGMDTYFRFWPVGIAITMIFSIFGSFWILIGYFFIDGEEYGRGRAITGIVSTLTAVGYFLFSYYVAPSFLPEFIAIGFLLTSRMFLLMALLNMLPLWGLDGQRIYEWDARSYWLMLAMTIVLIIVFAQVIF